MGGNAFSVRWLAPELIHPEELGLVACFRSKESDIYALAMLMYEVCSLLHVYVTPFCFNAFYAGVFWVTPVRRVS